MKFTAFGIPEQVVRINGRSTAPWLVFQPPNPDIEAEIAFAGTLFSEALPAATPAPDSRRSA